MAKLTPALLNGLIFDLMQPMAYFAALADNSKYVTSNCIENGYNLYYAVWRRWWLSGWSFQAELMSGRSWAGLLKSECWCLILMGWKKPLWIWPETSLAFLSSEANCQMCGDNPIWTLTGFALRYGVWQTPASKYATGLSCFHVFANITTNDTVVTWVMRGRNMVMSERWIQKDKVKGWWNVQDFFCQLTLLLLFPLGLCPVSCV